MPKGIGYSSLDGVLAKQPTFQFVILAGRVIIRYVLEFRTIAF